MNHVMIDIETLATVPEAVICSIGAVRFDPNTGKIDDCKFYTAVDWTDQPDRVVDGNTVQWWLQQADSARAAMIKPDAPTLTTCLLKFRRWLDEDAIVWGNGSTFDISILENAYRNSELTIPWRHFNVRDCRTIEDVASVYHKRSEFNREGTHHDAIADAEYQAKYISVMWQSLRSDYLT